MTTWAIIATVGRGMIHNPGTAARLCSALSREHVNVRMIDQGSSELSILVAWTAATSSPPSAPSITSLWAARSSSKARLCIR